jgi:triacylglycerol esterase/lipase EstA (alpha/beta hydrolase family)
MIANSLGETMALFEATKLGLGIPTMLKNAPKGDGHPVIVLPGFCAGQHSTMVLRYLLFQAGYKPIDWGQGINLGPSDKQDAALDALLSKSSEHEQVSLVGWSLGGLYARAMANEFPNKVRSVFTLGTPHKSDPSASKLRAIFDLLSPKKLSEVDLAELVTMLKDPPMPLTSIYTKSDGVVNWEDCIADGPQCENVEVTGSHLGLTHNLDVITALLERLPQR